MRALPAAALPLCFMLAASAPAPVSAQDAPPVAIAAGRNDSPRRGPSDPREIEAFLDGVMAAQLDEKHIAGAVVSVVRNGELLFAKGYGFADHGKRAPVDPGQTLFRIGSVSKLFTWTAVMQLVEQGKLQLDRDVNDYIDFTIPATYPQPITLRHLLTHTPGFEDRGLGLFNSKRTPRGEWLAENLPARVRPPGTFSAYSNYGTSLAGYIVERVSGMPWEEYVERRILQPLGMRNTTAREPLPPALAPQMSGGYEWKGDRMVARDFEVVGASAPAGSVSSSGADMARFMIAHLQHGRLGDARLFSDSTAQLMQRRAFTHHDSLNGFALGFYEKSSHGLRIIGHGGDTRWFHTDMALAPSESLGVFVSYNSAGGGELSFGPFLQVFLDHYYPQPPPPPAPRQVASSDSTNADRYAGTYRVNRASYTTLEKVFGLAAPVSVSSDPETGGVMVRSPLGTQRLVRTGPALFREVDGSDVVAFREGADGRATHLFLGAAPMLALERVPWYVAPTLHLAVLGIAVLLFLSVLIAVPVRYLMWRRFPDLRAAGQDTRAARRVAIAVALLNVAFLIGLAVVFGDPIEFLFRGEVGSLRVVLVLPVLAAILSLALLWFAVMAWRRGFWGRWGRLHYTAVALGSLAFAGVLAYWNVLGWRI